MINPYSPSTRSLAVPGIGFCQNISVGPDFVDFAGFREWPLTAPRKHAAVATDRWPRVAAQPACDGPQIAVN
jgi:hypothetical protein